MTPRGLARRSARVNIEGMDLLHATFSRYYETPSHAAVLELLRHLATGEQVMSLPNPDEVAYDFIRLGQLEPAIVEGYRHEAASAEGVGQEFIHFILHKLETEPPPDPLSVPIQTPHDLDHHWVEFFLTGAEAPVVRLIEVLEWPDLVRTRLEAWLLEKPSLFDFSRKGVAEHLERVAGIRCDLEARAVMTQGDLDCHCLQDGIRRRTREAIQQTLTALPFKLAPEELLRVAMKASALWSIGSNAQQHRKVLELCTREVGRRTGTTRQALEWVVAGARERSALN